MCHKNASLATNIQRKIGGAGLKEHKSNTEDFGRDY